MNGWDSLGKQRIAILGGGGVGGGAMTAALFLRLAVLGQVRVHRRAGPRRVALRLSEVAHPTFSD
jgi:hypothetical protein